MIITTKHFGEIEIDEQGILEFTEGVPGFEKAKRFIIMDNEDQSSPFKWLQCVDDASLAFVIANPFGIKKDYDIEIDEAAVSALGLTSTEDAAIFVIVAIPEDTSKISMNLKAPIIINVKNKKGMQVILDTNQYSVRHYILDELHRQEGILNASSDEKKGTDDRHK